MVTLRFVVTLRAGRAANIAFTVTDPSPVTLHALVPLHQPPDQPLKADPDTGVAVRVMVVPFGVSGGAQCATVYAVGLLTMVPVPVPPSAIVTVNPPSDKLLQARLEKVETPALLNAAIW